MTGGADEVERDVERVLASRSESAAYYDRLASVYDVVAEWPERAVRKRARQKLAVQPGERVLEIGIGTGTSLAAFAERLGGDGVVIGLDLAERMVARARARLDELGPEVRVRLVRGDASRLPFRASSLDALFIGFTLELFDTPEIPVVLSECRRVLRDGGRLVVLALSKAGPRDVTTRALEWTHRHFPHLLDCRPIHVAGSLQAAGFRVVEVLHERAWVPVATALATKSGDALEERGARRPVSDSG